jgi:hypothetical protein
MWAKGLNVRQRDERQKQLNQYWKEAKQFVKSRSDDPKNPDWYAFDWDSDARWQWENYFSWRLGFVPIGLVYLSMGKINEFFVPCEYPSEFDPHYSGMKP